MGTDSEDKSTEPREPKLPRWVEILDELCQEVWGRRLGEEQKEDKVRARR